jgi:hypothetical protein
MERHATFVSVWVFTASEETGAAWRAGMVSAQLQQTE